MLPIAMGMLLLALAACGGSGSKQAAAPATPVFTSTAPATGVEGAAYSYILSATASDGASVTFALTSSPAGATLSGSTINWTPTAAEAGAANQFAVTATTSTGGTNTQSWTVTVAVATTPVFTSVPPAAAVEGTVYSYAPSATSADGTGVTFALTSSPSGATLGGSTISWTPTPAEARLSNAFVVTATTGAGLTNTQSWTVTPSGTIRGSSIDMYWGANGSTAAPVDLSGYTFSALAPNAAGGFTSIAGAGNANGTFTIPGVPAGNYWLTYNDSEGNGPWSYWTSSSTFDIGADYLGRNISSVNCENTAALSLNLTGLDSLASDFSDLDIFVPNIEGGSGYSIAPGSPTTFAGIVNSSCPIDPASGDVTYVVQGEPAAGLASGFSGIEVPGPALVLNTLAAPAGSTTNVAGALTKTNPQSLDFAWQGAGWAADFNQVGPGVATLGISEAELLLQPFVSDRYAQGQDLALAGVASTGMSSNVDAGTVAYNNPFPSTWLPVYTAFAEASIADAAGNYAVNYGSTTTAPANGFAPLMSAVQNPTMNGGSLFTAASSNTTSVTLSWTAPAGLSPAGYEISYYCVDTVCPNNSAGTLYTASAPVTLPPGALTPGYDYGFAIGAFADSRANFNSSPNRGGYPQAYADVVSAPLSISATATAIIRGQAAITGGAGKNVIRSRYGKFLVTARGVKPLDLKARMLARIYQRYSSQASKTAATVK